MRTALLLALLLLPLAASADQAAYITKDQADQAVTALQDQRSIRHYCAPCGDKEFRTQAIYYSAEAVAVEGSPHFEVRTEGEGLDLAYVYVDVDGVWTNLAMRLKIPVQDVPETLAGVPGPLPNVWPVYFAGKLGGEHDILLWLTSGDEDFGGYYHYTRIGDLINVTGGLGASGTFTLTEHVDEKETGTFTGKFIEDGAAMEGTWKSADGAKTLPFTLKRVALAASEANTVILAGRSSDRSASYPVLLPAEEAWPKAVNLAVQASIRETRDSFANDYLTEWVSAYLPEATLGDETGPSWEYASDVGVSLQDLTDKFASFLFEVYSFTGGAHPMTYYETLNLLRTDSGVKPIGFEEIFKDVDGAVKAISTRLIEDLKRQEAGMVVDGSITAFERDSLSSFVVMRGGLVFHFSPYAVGPYAEGAFQVRVPWDVVKDYLHDGLPGAWFN